MRKIFQLLIVAVFVSGLSTVAYASPKVIAASFHADWCGSCKALGPVFKQVKGKYVDSNVLFVKFDKTDDGTSKQSKLLADALGIEDSYKSHQKTGFILLIDADSKEIKGKLTKVHTADEMDTILRRVLAGESVMEEMKGSGSDKMKGSGNSKMKGSQKGS